MANPAKKRRKVIKPNAKPGIIKQHLLDNFSMLPENNEFLNGHVLYLYVCLCESSRIRTVKELFSHLPSTSQHASESSVFSFLSCEMKKLVSRTLDSFKRSTDPKEFSRFESICQERFPLQRANPCNYMISRPAVQHDERPAVQHDERPAVQHDERPAVQHDERPAVQHDKRPAVQHDERPAVQHDERPAVQHDERPAVQHDKSTVKVISASKSSMTTRTNCSSCVTHREKLRAMSDKLRAQKEMCKQHCFTVRKNFVKRTNEKIKRKDLQIVKLQAKLDKSKVADKNLMLLQKRYNRLKNTHKAAKVELSNSLSLQKKSKRIRAQVKS